MNENTHCDQFCLIFCHLVPNFTDVQPKAVLDFSAYLFSYLVSCLDLLLVPPEWHILCSLREKKCVYRVTFSNPQNPSTGSLQLSVF